MTNPVQFLEIGLNFLLTLYLCNRITCATMYPEMNLDFLMDSISV